jgi:hypothetical protein
MRCFIHWIYFLYTLFSFEFILSDMYTNIDSNNFNSSLALELQPYGSKQQMFTTVGL